MWLYIFAFALLVFGIVGSILSGGIFTIAIVPLGVVALITAVIASMWARAQQGRAGHNNETSSGERPLPTGHSNTAAAPSTPEQLVDARREQQ